MKKRIAQKVLKATWTRKVRGSTHARAWDRVGRAALREALRTPILVRSHVDVLGTGLLYGTDIHTTRIK